MRFGIGIDLVSTQEVEESIRRHGRHYLERVYTEQELSDCGDDPERLAARFAAKEATMKALQRTDEGLSWRSIEVRRDADGLPSLKLTGPAADLARERGVEELSVSLTHQGMLAAAVVLAALTDERQPEH